MISMISGVMAATDGSLRVCHGGVLTALTCDGDVLWHIDLGLVTADDLPLAHALPTVLDTGQTLVLLPQTLVVVAPDGQRVVTFPHEEHLDDSGLSPNVTHSGWPLVSTPLGNIYVLREDQWVAIGDGEYGYDLVTPALYDDGSLAVAGYYGAGFCRVDLDGTMRWRSQFQEADLVPTVNRRQVAAVGSLNDAASALFAANGAQVGEYNHAAVFAAYGDEEWIAVSKTRLARLAADGSEIWGQGISMQRARGSIVQPIVDAEGYIFVRHDDGVRCCDAEGRSVFEVTLPSARPDPISIVASGLIACVAGDELLIGGF
jgi:outer membrane protein assembly factor BamB